MVTLLAALALQTTPATFQDLEDRKLQALNATSGFRGTYVIISIPSQGDPTRQEVTLAISPEGRKIRLNVNGQDVGESAYSKSSKWTALLVEKVYQIEKPEKGFALPPEAPDLRPQPGELAMTIDDLGVRFATNPPPSLTAPQSETVEGKKLTRFDAKTVNPETKTQVQITQWFDADSFILRQFEIVKTTDNRVSRVRGFLIKDKRDTKIDSGEFELPVEYSTSFRRVNG